MLRAGIIVGVALTFGCTINAPPAEELSGDALKVTDGKLQIDDTRVPVVAECSAGQVVARSADDQAWECVTVQSTTISAGSGSTVTQGEAGDFNVAVAFGDAATEAATGARALALEGRMGLVETGLGEANTSLGAADTAIDGRLDIAEADIDGLTLSLGAAEADIDGLTPRLDIAEADIDDLTPRLGAAEADIDGLTVDLGEAESAIDVRLDTAEADIAAAEGRLDTLQDRALIEYSSICNASAVGVFNLEAGILSFCDGEDFRTIEVAPSPPPDLVAQFTLASFLRVPSKTWPNVVVGGPEMFIGSRVVVQSLGNGATNGVINLNTSPTSSSPLAHMILELPLRNFSIEIVASGSGGLLFTHAPDGLSFSWTSCQGCERVITESGAPLRFITPPEASTDPASIRHFLYVHEADDDRILYENGVKTSVSTSSVTAPWQGPYLGGRGIFSLGGNATNVGFNPINNVVFFEASVFNTALSAAEAEIQCDSAAAAEPGFDKFCLL